MNKERFSKYTVLTYMSDIYLNCDQEDNDWKSVFDDFTFYVT